MPRLNYLLTAAQKVDAREALQILDVTDITLVESARRAVKGQRALRRVTFEVGLDEFVRAKIQEGARHATVDWYDERLRSLVDTLGGRIFDTISRADLKETLAATFPTIPARAASARASRALWRWGMHAETPFAGADITIGLDFKGRGPSLAQPKPKPPKVLTIAQCQAILDGLPAAYTGALGLMLFAGIRPEEVAGPQKEWMRWEHVSKADRLIRVPAELSKTTKSRVIENLPPALWRLIKPGPPEAAICPASARALVEWVKKLAGYNHHKATDRAAPTWPQDALRHTFATYALAFTQEPGQVAMWLGHEGKPELLLTTYRGERSADGIVTQAVARRFFALRRGVP